MAVGIKTRQALRNILSAIPVCIFLKQAQLPNNSQKTQEMLDAARQ